MIPVTDEPMEGVAFDVQDHARRTGTIWTGTHGEMTSSDLHGAEEPTRWMLRPHQGAETGWRWIRALHQRRRGRSIRGTLAELDLGGLTHFSVERWPPDGPGRHQEAYDVIMSIWQMDRVVGTCGSLESPRRANVLLFGCCICPRKG
jgi:hypothetical protein